MYTLIYVLETRTYIGISIMAIISFIKQAAYRTTRRFHSLYETLRDEYWKTHKHFRRYGCSLHPKDVSKRSSFTANLATTFIFLVTLPIAVYYRGIDVFDTWFLFGMLCDFLVIWCLFYALVLAAHGLFVLSFVTGNKFGSSKMFLNYVGKRWGKRIDEIADKFIAENAIIMDKKSLEVNDKGACGDNCDINKNQSPDKLTTAPENVAEPDMKVVY